MKFEYGIIDMSTRPAPNIVLISVLVGVTTNSRSTPSACVRPRSLARKMPMLQKPEPWVALMVVAAIARVGASSAARWAGMATLAAPTAEVLRKLRREKLRKKVPSRSHMVISIHHWTDPMTAMGPSSSQEAQPRLHRRWLRSAIAPPTPGDPDDGHANPRERSSALLIATQAPCQSVAIGVAALLHLAGSRRGPGSPMAHQPAHGSCTR